MRSPRAHADGFVEDGQELSIGSLKVRVIYTPGHSPGHVMYHFPDQKILIGGDLIIMNAVGRTDLPDSNEADLYDSIRKVMKLPGDTHLLTGHGEATILQAQADYNPYVAEALGGNNRHCCECGGWSVMVTVAESPESSTCICPCPT